MPKPFVHRFLASLHSSRRNAQRRALRICVVVMISTLSFPAAHGQIAANIGEYAKKFPGGPGLLVHPDQRLELKMKISRPFTAVAVGDLLEFQPFSTDTDQRIQSLVAVTRGADVTVGDFENELMDFDNFGYYGFNLGTKEVADDWANMGIKMVTRANNKVQSAPGIWEDLRQVERVGIVHVGVGHTLADARMPRYIETSKGLVGFVGVWADGGTSVCCQGGRLVHVTAAQLAEVRRIKQSILARRDEVEVPIPLPSPDLPGTVNLFGLTFSSNSELPSPSGGPSAALPRGARIGMLGAPPKITYNGLTKLSLGTPIDGVVNALHVTQYHGVTSAQMQVLRAIAAKPGQGEDLDAFGKHFRVMKLPGEYSYDMNPLDLHQILTQIKTGKEAADFLIVNVHWHQNRYAFQHYSYDHFPADFELKFAHEAIDEGADMVVGEGVHTLKGVEIYKGKPIFYGVSNYVFESGLMPLPGHGAALLRAFGDHRAPRPDALGIIGGHQQQGFFQLLPNLEAEIAWARFDKGKLTEVKVYPVDLGQMYRPADRLGIPMKPTPPVAKKILNEVIEYSKPFGTNITIEKDVGVIRVN